MSNYFYHINFHICNYEDLAVACPCNLFKALYNYNLANHRAGRGVWVEGGGGGCVVIRMINI